MNTRKSLEKTARWQIVLEPWCWPYGESETPYGVGYIDTEQKEPWEILAARERYERTIARLEREAADREVEEKARRARWREKLKKRERVRDEEARGQ